MERLSGFLVRRRNVLLVLFLLFAVVCLFLSRLVEKNGDLKSYLPESSATKRGWELMKSEFPEDDASGTLKIMLRDLDAKEAEALKKEFASLGGVNAVSYEERETEEGGKRSLYTLTVGHKASSAEASAVYRGALSLIGGREADLAGNVYLSNVPILPPWVMLLAVGIVLTVLLVMSDSWLSPFLFLISILSAIAMNVGTNVIFGRISSITDAIAAILQLALSMDYSIMLMARYRQERQNAADKQEALKNALRASFSSIASSAQTTIVGLLTLVFMSFTIGRDMGFVLAKGVLLSLLCTFCVLPALIALFDRAILKTAKKAPRIGTARLSSFAYRARLPLTVCFVVLFAVSAFLQGNRKMTYTGAELDNVSAVFGQENDMALIYKKELEEEVRPLLERAEKEERVKIVLSNAFFDKRFTYGELPQALAAAGVRVGVHESILRALFYLCGGGQPEGEMSVAEFVSYLAQKANGGVFDGFLDGEAGMGAFMGDAAALLRISNEAGDARFDADGMAEALSGTAFTKELVRAGYLLYASENHPVENKLSLRELSDFLKKEFSGGFGALIGEQTAARLASSFDLAAAEKKLNGEHFARAVIRTDLPTEGKETFAAVEKLNGIFAPVCEKGAYLFGDSTYAYEMDRDFSGEFFFISVLTMAAIFLIVALTFRSAAIPLILIAVIQCAVYVTMAIMHLAGMSIFFLAVIVLQSILMGATIDYAILFTSFYRENRKSFEPREAVKKAYERSIGTILTSSAILLVGTLLVGWTAIEMVSKICLAIGYGTLAATILILVFTPAMLTLFDRFTVKKEKKKKIEK